MDQLLTERAIFVLGLKLETKQAGGILGRNLNRQRITAVARHLIAQHAVVPHKKWIANSRSSVGTEGIEKHSRYSVITNKIRIGCQNR